MRHWYTRYKISSALDGGDLPAVLARGHASRCTACQGFAARLGAQHALLVQGAGSAPAPRPAGQRRPRLVLGAPLAVGAILALAIAVTVLRRPEAPAPAPLASGDGSATAPPEHAPPVAVPVREVTARVSALFATASDPLDTELHNLLGDGRRGLDTILATGGLPRVFADHGASRD
ncbi:MAG TPA: hypothetical protein VH165_06475 [Kofleriaceae bacterium]|jgi:hypothetical protein|nr:hypothetical protein [Kofleriaceae bacterium]